MPVRAVKNFLRAVFEYIIANGKARFVELINVKCYNLFVFGVNLQHFCSLYVKGAYSLVLKSLVGLAQVLVRTLDVQQLKKL